MPTYTYRCSKCGDEIEVFQSMSDPPLKRCKKCRGALRRTFHPVGIVLKGSGFYKTDYGTSGKDGAKRSGSSSSSSEKSDDSKKSDSSSKSEGSSKDSSSKGSKESKSSSTD